jgi:hypothetical protein
MTSFVTIDAGVAFKLLVPNPQREEFKGLVRQWASDRHVICAPDLWIYELTPSSPRWCTTGKSIKSMHATVWIWR